MLADVLGMEVEFTATVEGSSFGAALLGLQALGAVPSVDVAAELVTVENTARPDSAAAETYAALQPVFFELYDALVPSFTALRRLSPQLPIDLMQQPGANT
jgi:gluconokinase